MARYPCPAGVSLGDAQRRMMPGYMVPTIVTDGTDATASVRARGTATASATPHTKGTYTQMIAATTSEIQVIHLALTADTFAPATDTSTLLDIAIGANLSEVVIVSNLAVGWTPTTNSFGTPIYEIPVNIPLGSRVAIRCQSAVISKTVAVQMTFAQIPNGRRVPGTLVTMGDNTATSRGVSLTTPASNNTKAAWAQITAATTQPLDALFVGLQGAGDTTQNTNNILVDIGYGANSAEIVLAPNLPVMTSTSESVQWEISPLIPCRLPTGTRLAARWQGSSAVGGTLDVILYGVPA